MTAQEASPLPGQGIVTNDAKPASSEARRAVTSQYTASLCTTRQMVEKALAVRIRVFCDEQGYDPETDIDE